MGLKTTYYLRTLAASQVEKSTVSTAEYGSTHQREASASQEPRTKNQFPVQTVEVAAVPIAVVAQKIEAPVLKALCRIDDPNCEACQ
jgi:ribonucleoside-diphosphate reductase alpha chain